MRRPPLHARFLCAVFSLMAGAGAAPAAAQQASGDTERFRISAAFRARVETIDGQPRADIADSDTALLLRTQVAAEYDAGPVSFVGEVVDSRVYFQARRSSVTSTEVNAFEPLQAYAHIDVAPRTKVQIGRFTMDIGARRLVSRNGYRNTINGFTGVRFDTASDAGGQLTLFWVEPQQRVPSTVDDVRDNAFVLDQERNDQQFFGIFGRQADTILGTVDVYGFGLVERDDVDFQTRDRRLGTVGGRIAIAPHRGRFDYEIEGAYQFGHSSLGTAEVQEVRRPVRAGTFQAIAGYTFDTPIAPRLVASFDYASGDAGQRRVGRYDSLFGSRSFEFGPTSLFGLIQRTNLVSPSVRFDARGKDRWDTTAGVRLLWLASATDSFGASNVRDPSGASGRHVGAQYDARLRWWAVPERIQIGLWGAILHKGRFLRDAPNAPRNGDGRYLSVETIFSF